MTSPETHSYVAIAFAENFHLRELAASYPEARRSSKDLRYSCGPAGQIFLFPFGAIVFADVPPEQREAELARLRRVLPGLTAQVIREEFNTRPAERLGIVDGVLGIDGMTPERSAIVAFTVAQSAAMEYYERIVDEMFGRTALFVDRLERRGTVSLKTRPLHRFIGEAIAVRSEVIMVLALLDKPDETWDDPAIDRIYAELRAEFDLVDRYSSLEMKQRSFQDALELILGVARERRLLLLEAAVVLLIAAEILLPVLRLR